MIHHTCNVCVRYSSVYFRLVSMLHTMESYFQFASPKYTPLCYEQVHCMKMIRQVYVSRGVEGNGVQCVHVPKHRKVCCLKMHCLQFPSTVC